VQATTKIFGLAPCELDPTCTTAFLKLGNPDLCFKGRDHERLDQNAREPLRPEMTNGRPRTSLTTSKHHTKDDKSHAICPTMIGPPLESTFDRFRHPRIRKQWPARYLLRNTMGRRGKRALHLYSVQALPKTPAHIPSISTLEVRKRSDSNQDQ